MKIKTIAQNRKEIVVAISEVTNLKAAYQGPPTFGYKIGEFTVDREGMVETMNQENGLEMKRVLIEKGLCESEADSMELKIPIESHTGASLKNLVFIIHSKQYLLNKAVGRQTFQVNEALVSKLEKAEPESIEDFMKILNENGGNEANYGFYFTDDAIVFDGFPLEGDKVKAYVELSTMMCTTARNQKRVSPKESIEENEKYYMRVWLVRLGLGGQGGKETRKIMLEKLKGHTAFRTVEEKERAKVKAKAKGVDTEE